MAYNDSVKFNAYSLYLQGLSYDDIATRVKTEMGLAKLRGATIRAWAEKSDEKGETWEDYRTKVRAVMRRNVDDVAASKLTELQTKTETILEALYAQITATKSPKIKSFEGAVYAFKTISEFSLALDEKNRDHLHPLLIVQAMLEVFQEIPDVRRAIKTNWERIYREIQERLQIGKAPKGKDVIEYEPDTQ